MIKSIRLIGWSGVVLGLFAVITRTPDAFLCWQLIASISALLWNVYLQKRWTWDVIVSFTLTALAAIIKDVNLVYAAMLIRSISYQFVFEKVVYDRRNPINHPLNPPSSTTKT